MTDSVRFKLKMRICQEQYLKQVFSEIVVHSGFLQEAYMPCTLYNLKFEPQSLKIPRP